MRMRTEFHLFCVCIHMCGAASGGILLFVESIFARAFARSYHHRLLMAVTCQLFNFSLLFSITRSLASLSVSRSPHTHTQRQTHHPLRSRVRVIHAACRASTHEKCERDSGSERKSKENNRRENTHAFYCWHRPMTVRTNWTFAW